MSTEISTHNVKAVYLSTCRKITSADGSRVHWSRSIRIETADGALELTLHTDDVDNLGVQLIDEEYTTCARFADLIGTV